MTAPVWAEALSAGAYFAAGVLTCIAAGVRPPLRSKALAALFDLALGVSAGVLFIGVTELFFDGTVTVSACSAFAAGVVISAAFAVRSPPKPVAAREGRKEKKADAREED